ncbi:MAG TPA: hypothetical protein VL134_08500 [Leptolyngbya sp.]|nr:hypothetical protein [Leptolyngbya sp.]
MLTTAPVLPAIAQSPRHVDAAEFPTQAATVQAFVPKGWQVEASVNGDLNDDRKPDTVLKLIETGAENADHARALLVLQQQKGQWRRIGVAPHLLLCSNCGGVLGSPDGANIQIEIKNGVLLVHQFRGSREATETLHRFWLDKASNRMLLIGRDVNEYDRITGDATVESSNFLTGQKITEHYTAQKLVSRQRSTIPRTQPTIESVNIEAL